MKVALRTIAAQPSWVVRSSSVELAVTQLGGHMAPVTFCRDTARPVQPYYISPWQGEACKLDEPVLVPLRGDFFCMPFGANEQAYRGKRHHVHGEPGGAKWRFVALETSGAATTLMLSMRTKVRPGTVTKRLGLVDGQNVVYVQHVLEGYSGLTPLGHHATLAVPAEPGSLRVATSKFKIGRTNPAPGGDPASREYGSLAPDEGFRDLARVPLVWKDPAYGDLTSFPARTGFTDIAAVFKTPGRTPAWIAATVAGEGYMWYSLKDAAVLPATVLWIANRGRHGAPWNGRNRCLALEDVCGYFADGLAASVRANPISKAGIPTAVKLSPKTPTAVNCIQGVVKVPRSFQTVRSARFADGKVIFRGAAGKEVTAAVNWKFLATGEL